MAYHKSIPGMGGRIYIVPSGSNPTPVQLAVIKSWNLDLSQEQVELRGSGLDALDVLPTKRECKGKLQLSDFSSKLIQAVTSGTTISAGTKIGTVHTAAVPTTPFAITVTNSATFDKDLGVIDRTAGKELKEVASAPATGEYSFAAGVYTFAAADTGHNMAISYRYTASSEGVSVEVAAADAGVASTTYEIHVYGAAGGKKYGFHIPAARIPNLSLSMSPDQFSDVSVDFTAFLDSNSKLLYAYLPE